MEEVLVAEDVRRSYGETVAVDGVSLSVEAGEVFALIGPNGAGKTTLVRALTGTTAAEGTVRLFDAEAEAVDPERIGLLPQEFAPAERLTPRELLDYYAGLYDRARDTAAVLRDVGLADAADTRYENLSGGQRRRTCVGLSLVNDPDLLFLDEPTTGIDPAGRRSLWRLLERLSERGTTTLLTTHAMDEAHRLADRVGLMESGRLLAVDDPDALVEGYGGRSTLVVEIETEGNSGPGSDVRPDTEPDVTIPETLRSEYEVTRSDGAVTFRGVAPIAIGDVVDSLRTAGIEYTGLAWSEPTLEDVYLELTGTAVDESGEPVESDRSTRPRGTP